MQVDERRSKTIAMSADESLEADRLGFDTGDWNFTVRTGMSYSNSRNGSGANSRTHSRSNSRMGSFSYGIDASSSNSTQGASHSRSNSRSFSCSQSHSGGGGGGGLEFSIAVRSSSAMKEGMFRSSSSDSDAGSADDILSDDGNGAPTPKSVHGRRTPTPAAVAEAVTTTAGAIAGTTGTGATTSFDYEGISFPTHYPPKQRAGKSPSGRIGSGSPTNSNSNNNGGSANLSSPRNGPPPRPKHLSIVESNGSTSASSGGSSSGGAAAALQGGALSSSSAEWSQQAEASRRQEERLANLQAEVQALVRENALLRSLSAPYLRTLDTLAKHERCSSVVASPDKNLTSAKSSSAANSSVRQEKSISDDIPDIPSFTAGVQRIIYPSRSSSAGPAAGKPALTAEELVGYATALTKRSLRGSSTAHASIVRPALNQLKNRVSSRIQHLTQACAGAAAGAGVGEGSIKLGSGTKRGGAAEQLKDVLGLLTVAFSALDAFDESNPVRRHQQQTAAAVTVAAAVNAAKVAATSDQLHSPSISLTAPTPRAVHGSASPEKMPPGASISLSGQEQGRMSDAVVMATEDSVVPGVGSLDLVTLLIAYLEDDLKQVPPSAGAKR